MADIPTLQSVPEEVQSPKKGLVPLKGAGTAAPSRFHIPPLFTAGNRLTWSSSVRSPCWNQVTAESHGNPEAVAGQRCASEQQSQGAEGKAAPPGAGLTSGWSCLCCPHVILPAGMEQVSKC